MHTSSHTTKLLLSFIAILSVFTAYAELERNNIFLFDITGSMRNNGTWIPALNALDATIGTQSQDQNAEFTIIPFGTHSYQSFNFKSGEYPNLKTNIRKEFVRAMRLAQFTNISSVLKDGIRNVNPAKMNRIYLLTDGEPSGGDTSQAVADIINQWCGNHKNTRLFYVALNRNAVNPIIREAIERCNDAFIVTCTDNVIPQIEDLNTNDINASIDNLGQLAKIKFSSNGSHHVSVECDDPIFNVEAKDGIIADRLLILKISPKGGESPEQLHSILSERVNDGETYEFSITVNIDDRNFRIANPEVTVHMADPILSNLSIFNGNKDAIDGGKAVWYDSFLFSKSAEQKPVIFDLAPIFTNNTAETSATFRVMPGTSGKNGCSLLFNGKKISFGENFTINADKPAVLSLVFDTGAQQGNHDIRLSLAGTSGLNNINNIPAEEYNDITLCAEYEIIENPAEKYLWGIIILIFVALLGVALWNNFLADRIKINTITLTGPGSFYLSKKIKGARKVILTTKHQQQSLLSRFFYGKTIYIHAEHFSPQIVITPGTKRRIRLSSDAKNGNSWDFIPSATIATYETCTVQHHASAQKFNIEAQ